jgi:hypothetical protein
MLSIVTSNFCGSTSTPNGVCHPDTGSSGGELTAADR